jgi:hypothetical protein
VPRIYAFPYKIFHSGFSWCEMPPGKPRRDNPVGFFRKGIIYIPRPQPSFNMSKWNLVIKASERNSQDRRRIALSKNDIGLVQQQHSIQPAQKSTDQRCQRLIWTHCVQINIWLDTEVTQYLVKQEPMLCRGKNANIRPRLFAQRKYQWCHLDCLWTSSHYANDLLQDERLGKNSAIITKR